MAVTYNDTTENIAYLAALFGFEPIVTQAWIRLEGQATPNPTNPLNIRNSLEMIGQNASGFAYFETPLHGLYSAKQVITRNRASYGYQAILDAAWSRDPMAQAKTIEASSWAAGHYGADWPAGKQGSISNYVEAHSVQQITISGDIQYGSLGTIPANIEILDGNGKVITKTTAEVTGVPLFGLTEDGWTAILWTAGVVRFVRAPVLTTTVDPCADEAKAAVDALNARIDAAQRA